jgi:hypothetical protein
LRQGPPHDEPIFGKVTIREEGRAMHHPVYLLQAKSPAESHEDWDYFEVVAPIPPSAPSARSAKASARSFRLIIELSAEPGFRAVAR